MTNLFHISLEALDLPVCVDTELPLFDLANQGREVLYAVGHGRVHVRPENLTRFHLSAFAARISAYLEHGMFRPQAQA